MTDRPMWLISYVVDSSTITIHNTMVMNMTSPCSLLCNDYVGRYHGNKDNLFRDAVSWPNGYDKRSHGKEDACFLMLLGDQRWW